MTRALGIATSAKLLPGWQHITRCEPTMDDSLEITLSSGQQRAVPAYELRQIDKTLYWVGSLKIVHLLARLQAQGFHMRISWDALLAHWRVELWSPKDKYVGVCNSGYLPDALYRAWERWEVNNNGA